MVRSRFFFGFSLIGSRRLQGLGGQHLDHVPHEVVFGFTVIKDDKTMTGGLEGGFDEFGVHRAQPVTVREAPVERDTGGPQCRSSAPT
jgi:hypothetical protein